MCAKFHLHTMVVLAGFCRNLDQIIRLGGARDTGGHLVSLSLFAA
jgi:hypothetical protein